MASERDAAQRQAWRAALAAITPHRCVCLDEPAMPTPVTRRRARAPRGERAGGSVPPQRWERVTVRASLPTRGMGAAMVRKGALARERFEAYGEQVLLPTLLPGPIVGLDPWPGPTRARARRLLEAAGCTLLFLPAYSPACNPLELACAKLKQPVRRAAQRTLAGIVAATGPALEAGTAADTRGCFAHCGYHLSGQLVRMTL